MSVTFDYTAELLPLQQKLYPTQTWESKEIVNPSSAVFFHDLFNPGHNGQPDFFSWYFELIFVRTDSSGAATLDIVIEFRERGGSWQQVSAETLSVADGAASGDLIVSRNSDLVLSLPVEVRILGTDTDYTWYLQKTDSHIYAMRAAGTVS